MPDYSGPDPIYDIGVCCRATKTTLDDLDGDKVLDYACIGQPESTYTALSDESNAHAEFPIDNDNTFKWGENYDYPLCMNSTGEIRCEAHQSSDTPPGNFSASECVFGLSSENNAHVYACGRTPTEPGFLKVYCTDETEIEEDMLKLSLKAFNGPPGEPDRRETTTFYTPGTIYLELAVTNFTGEQITVPGMARIEYYVKDTEPEIKGTIENAVLDPGQNILNVELSIPENVQSDSYILEAVANYPSDPVPENNHDIAYITILLGTTGTTIPETSPLLIVLIAFGVLFIIGGNAKKKLKLEKKQKLVEEKKRSGFE